MEVIIGDANLKDARKNKTFQDELPRIVDCTKCQNVSRNILMVDDANGELADQNIKRVEGIPIHPHDSCVFNLYMCTICGHVDVIWNQG